MLSPRMPRSSPAGPTTMHNAASRNDPQRALGCREQMQQNVCSNADLLDHLVAARKLRRRHFKTSTFAVLRLITRLCLVGGLHSQRGRVLALEDAVHIAGCAHKPDAGNRRVVRSAEHNPGHAQQLRAHRRRVSCGPPAVHSLHSARTDRGITRRAAQVPGDRRLRALRRDPLRAALRPSPGPRHAQTRHR